MPYLDRNHPLSYTPSQGEADETKFRLYEAFGLAKEARKKDPAKGVASRSEWARKVTGKPYATAKVADKWLSDPAKMTADEVGRTCEVFNCTIEELQGKFTRILRGQLTDTERIAAEFEALTQEHKEAAARVIDALFEAEADIAAQRHRAEVYFRFWEVDTEGQE